MFNIAHYCHFFQNNKISRVFTKSAYFFFVTPLASHNQSCATRTLKHLHSSGLTPSPLRLDQQRGEGDIRMANGV